MSGIAAAVRAAKALHKGGDLAGAERAYEAILDASPDEFDALHLLGVLRMQQGRNEEAVRLFGLANRSDARNAACHNNLGNALHALGRHAEAVASYGTALGLVPENADMLVNLASALAALDRHAEALAACERALALRPGTARAHAKRGIALCALERHEEAIVDFDAAIAIDPGNAEAHRNRGVALYALTRDREAALSYARAIALRAEDADAHWNLSHALLRAGDYEAGWPEYEWRWKQAEPAAIAGRIRGPRWTGREDPAGRTILVYAEQGLGDTLMAVRYVPLLASRGARVLLEVQPRLKSLLAGIEGAAAVFARGEPLPAFDLQCPLFSLPHAFGTTLASVPTRVPYIAAPAARVAYWQSVLAGVEGLRAGLAWSGARGYANDHNRSIPPALLGPLLAVPRVAWYALPRDIDADAAAVLARYPGVTRIGAELGDFAEIAAFVTALDLVVTVDTSFGHVAGALGRPVWLLHARSPDWRWLLGREDSPWYPSARLFRQHVAGDWEAVIARAASALRQWPAAPPRAPA